MQSSHVQGAIGTRNVHVRILHSPHAMSESPWWVNDCSKDASDLASSMIASNVYLTLMSSACVFFRFLLS